MQSREQLWRTAVNTNLLEGSEGPALRSVANSQQQCEGTVCATAECLSSAVDSARKDAKGLDGSGCRSDDLRALRHRDQRGAQALQSKM